MRIRRATTSGTPHANLDPQHRPPSEELPASVVKLLDERDRVSIEAAAARREQRVMIDEWTALVAEAERADAAAAADAARRGEFDPDAKPHADDLDRRRRDLNHKVASFTRAADAAANDIVYELEAVWSADGAAMEAQHAKARARLAKAVDAMVQAASDANAVAARIEWFKHGQALDLGAPVLDPAELVPAVHGRPIGLDNTPPVPLDAVAEAIRGCSDLGA